MKRNLDNHPKIDGFLTLVAFISSIILIIFIMIVPGTANQRQEKATKVTKIETVLKETNLSDLQSYFVNELGADDIDYNKETKRIIIDTNKSSYVENIAEIDNKLAQNDKIKSVEFTNEGKFPTIILIINLK